MDQRFERLAVAREVLAERRARRRRAEGEDSAKPSAAQDLENKANREIADFAPQWFQGLAGAKAKRFSFASEIFPFASEISASFSQAISPKHFAAKAVSRLDVGDLAFDDANLCACKLWIRAAALYLGRPPGYTTALFRTHFLDQDPRKLLKKPIGITTAAPGPGALDLSIVSALAEIAGEHDLSEVEVEHGGLRVRVVRERNAASVTHFVAAPAAPVAPAAPAAPEIEVPPTELPGAVKSPMVGTAYLRPSPESKAFVEVGSLVKSGEKIMLVEAMKTYNEIVAPRAGKITHIFVEDGSPVEYDQALMVIE